MTKNVYLEKLLWSLAVNFFDKQVIFGLLGGKFDYSRI